MLYLQSNGATANNKPAVKPKDRKVSSQKGRYTCSLSREFNDKTVGKQSGVHQIVQWQGSGLHQLVDREKALQSRAVVR